MTENEAIKQIKSKACNDRCISSLCNDGCMYGGEKCAFAMAIEALEEVQQTRTIGTVEEFKALKEKEEPKKVKGISLTHESRVGNCPNCNQFVVEKYNKKCKKCGQALLWE